jgi:hypothetical protein
LEKLSSINLSQTSDLRKCIDHRKCVHRTLRTELGQHMILIKVYRYVYYLLVPRSIDMVQQVAICMHRSPVVCYSIGSEN